MVFFFWLIASNRPHTLSAEELHTAYLTPYLQQATTMLETRLSKTQEDNKALMQRIKDQRAEMESLVQGLEGVVADLEGSVEALTAQKGARGVNVLKAEVREMHAEIQASR